MKRLAQRSTIYVKPALVLFCALAALSVPVGTASAHKPSDAYLRLDVRGAELRGRLDVSLRDLEQALGLDQNGDGAITWGEVRSREAELARYLTERVVLRGDAAVCPLRAGELRIVKRGDGAYAALDVAATCVSAPAKLAVDYRLFADLDSTHRGLLRLGVGATTETGVLVPGGAAREIALSGGGAGAELAQFVGQGMFHIFIGFDHILFLLALLFPAVLRREDGRWIAAANLRAVLGDALKIVTAFTIAHSITLTLAALGVLQLPGRLVEAAIAVSVIVAALNNLMPVMSGTRWWVAFSLGLLHGFGFFGVLAELGLERGELALPLLGFNVGVELGQLCIVAVFLPVAFFARHSWAYQRLAVVGGSAAIATLALLWSVERIFDTEILVF